MLLVTGATGHVGRHLVRQLVDEDHPVRAVTRDPAAAGLPAGVDVVGADLTEPGTVAPHLAGVDTVFLLWPLLSAEPVAALLDLLAGRHVVYLSSEGVPDDPAEARDGITGMHAAIERLIVDRGLPYTMLRPTGFATNTLGWAAQIRAGDVVRAPFGTLARPLIHERDIAAVAVAALTDDSHLGQIHHLSGPARLTQVEQARTIGEALGRPVRFEEQPLPAARAAMIESWGDPALVDQMLATWSTMDSQPERVTDTVEKVTGVPAHTFRRWAFDHAADFR